MMKNVSIKQRLQKGEIVIGPWCTVPSPTLTNVIASSGMDFIIIDTEHSAINSETAENMIRAAKSEGMASFVRLGEKSALEALKALDSGAEGIIVPHIESVKDAQEVISFTKYHPFGQRGFSPFTRAGGYFPEDFEEHAKRQNEDNILTLLLEGKNGINDLERILELGNIDAIYIGAYDLSQSLGFPGQVDHPQVRKCMEECMKKIRNKNVAAGGYVAKSKDDIKWMVDIGMQIITYLVDASLIYQVFKGVKHNFDEVIGR